MQRRNFFECQWRSDIRSARYYAGGDGAARGSGRNIALRGPRRVQRRNFVECQWRLDIRSARYYAGGDGAARHPYHRAKQIRLPAGRGPADVEAE